ncbi:MAG: hypothetical protein HQM08_10775 [Candidatus Riflebacteria bacterium]|nr:hypothetical protein [Candidatus Riflebacteria bacterium]
MDKKKGTAKKKVVKSVKKISKPVQEKAVKITKTPVKKVKAVKVVKPVKKVKVELPSRLEKPWSITRIRNFMRLWGMTQVEMAIFCGVSYDSVTSWSRGRRRLVRRSIAEHLETAEKLALEKHFPKSPANSRNNSWLQLRKFCHNELKIKSFPALAQILAGEYPIKAIETKPRDFRKATKAEKIEISKTKAKDTIAVKLTIGKKTVELSGKRLKLGGNDVIGLFAEEGNDYFFNGKAGCISIAQNAIRVSLWPAKELPLRLLGAAAN